MESGDIPEELSKKQDKKASTSDKTNGAYYWFFGGKETDMDYIKAFETHLIQEGKADKTIQSYTGDTMGFITHLVSKDLSFDGILGRFTVGSYKNHLLKDNYQPTTINKKLNSLQSFNDFPIYGVS